MNESSSVRISSLIGLPSAFAAQLCSQLSRSPVIDAMRAELKRSMTLTLNQLDKPYYLSYSVDDNNTWAAAATLWVDPDQFQLLPPSGLAESGFASATTNSITPTSPAAAVAAHATTSAPFPLRMMRPPFGATSGWQLTPPIKVLCNRSRAKELPCGT